MPVIKLGERLGNQLFQVAFAVAQAARSGPPLLLDGSGVDEEQRAFLEAWTGPIPQADSGWAGKLHRKWRLTVPAQWFESYGTLPPLSDLYPTHWMTV